MDSAESPTPTLMHFQFRPTAASVSRAGWIVALVAATSGAHLHAVEADAAASKASGFRQLHSQHLTLHTDLPPSAEVDALPGYFDQAFAQWCAYFAVDPAAHADWHVHAHLMKSRERFAAAGLLPDDLPDVFTGYTRGDKIWLFDQTSDYYRRHLLVHEGTHAFMDSLVAGKGPPWYSEGMAELLATHRVENGKLTLDYFPRSRDEVPKWGRIEIVQSGYAARRALSLPRILAYENRAYENNDPYGWCWAAAAFLDRHPRYQERFRQLPRLAGSPDFNEQLKKLFAADWVRLNEDWQLFVANLDYDYDFERMDVDFAAGKPLADAGANVTVAADRGWQPTGVQINAGQSVRLRATGRYQVAREPRAWECEPGGVTIHYYRGQPLGILLAAIRNDDPQAKGPNGLLKPIVVGRETTIRAPHAGTLYLRINDSAGSLADNAGTLNVEISRP